MKQDLSQGPEFEHLEDWLRGQMQGPIQDMLEEEVNEFLGRAEVGIGYTPPRKLTLSSGTIQVRRSRVRDTEERSESRSRIDGCRFG